MNAFSKLWGKNRRTGAWLITYADLMTLLVCFFVLIISFSIQDEAKMQIVAGSIREAFGVTEERRYAGDVDLSGVPETRQPGAVRPVATPSGEGIDETLSARPASGMSGRRGAYENADADRRRFEAVREKLEHAILMRPIAKDANDAITINLTENGLQVLIVDTAGRAMFAPGASEPTLEAKALLEETARALIPLANRIIIEAHADATGAGAYSAFELTAARANAARRIMEAAGLPSKRIAGVTGRGEAFPLFPEDPYAAGNRRIEITLEPAAPLLPDERPL
ncbi:MAG: flagellar motor protein MotB [Parvularculaceae bacterium]|nr:OmpA family protein [Parvularculaceae bacterium]